MISVLMGVNLHSIIAWRSAPACGQDFKTRRGVATPGLWDGLRADPLCPPAAVELPAFRPAVRSHRRACAVGVVAVGTRRRAHGTSAIAPPAIPGRREVCKVGPDCRLRGGELRGIGPRHRHPGVATTDSFSATGGSGTFWLRFFGRPRDRPKNTIE